jgi:hypothetical protein
MAKDKIANLQKLAEQGDPEAQFSLGDYYWQERNFDQAGYWHSIAAEQWRKKAEQGDSRAQYKLGLCYHNAEGVPYSNNNNKNAVFWWTKAGEQGYCLAEKKLWNCYRYGEAGLPKNFCKAKNWYSKYLRRYSFSYRVRCLWVFTYDYCRNKLELPKMDRYTLFYILEKMYRFKMLRGLCYFILNFADKIVSGRKNA